MSPVPELPGTLVPRQSPQEQWLKSHVAHLCQLEHERFPGSQPVSFAARDLEKLETQDYWVCEKSDGIRLLFLVATDHASGSQSVYIIDRHNTYRELSGLFFPHHENPLRSLGNTIVDGELVLDVDPQTKQETLRFLAFDCLVVDDQKVMTRSLDKRYGRLKEWFFKPYSRMIRDHPHVTASHPFDIKVKDITFSYHVDKVFSVDIPALQHGTDGLIYTCVNAPYSPGTDQNILKWKPPSENSIDFKLVLRFPPLKDDPTKPDFCAKPFFLLHAWCGDDRSGKSKYEEYDVLYVEDDEWEKLKATRAQIDDRIVEVHWDPVISQWRMMRFRDDKPTGNHKSTVENVISSIADGVEKEALLARSNAIRNAWKMRLAQAPVQHPPAGQMIPAPPAPQHTQVAKQRVNLGPPPPIEFRYGPLAPSRWSKVSGPAVIAGIRR